ncbi:MAG: YdcF family protein [Polyangiaceae bacterium]
MISTRITRSLARALAAPLDPKRLASPAEPADAIVILGAPIRDAEDLPPLAEERVRTGVELWRRGLGPVICITGGHTPRGFESTSAEAEGMARWVRKAGVPDSALRVDREARNTQENAARAADLLFPEGRRRVWLVTQQFHMKRAVHLFRRVGFEPLAHLIEDGVQDRHDLHSLKWIAREYGSWALLAARRAAGRDSSSR